MIRMPEIHSGGMMGHNWQGRDGFPLQMQHLRGGYKGSIILSVRGLAFWGLRILRDVLI